MRFGLGPLAAAADGVAPDLDWPTAAGYVELAQEEGFDSLWVEPEGQLGGSSPIVAATVLAGAATDGSIVARPVLGLAHPVSLAEEAATFDNVARGRGVLAPRDLPDPDSLRAYGVSADEAVERFWEAVDVVHRCWAPEPFAHEGRFWRIPAGLPEHADRVSMLSVTPKPSQSMIPLWVGTTSDRSVAMAAERGLPVMGEAWATRAELASTFERHRAEGAPMTARLIRPAVRDVLIDETTERAWSLATAALEQRYRDERAAGWPVRDGAVRSAAAERAVVGDVQTVLDELHAYAEAGVNYLVCRMIATDRDAIRRTAVLMGRAVAPHLKMFHLPVDMQVNTMAEAQDPVLPVLRGTF